MKDIEVGRNKDSVVCGIYSLKKQDREGDVERYMSRKRESRGKQRDLEIKRE